MCQRTITRSDDMPPWSQLDVVGPPTTDEMMSELRAHPGEAIACRIPCSAMAEVTVTKAGLALLNDGWNVQYRRNFAGLQVILPGEAAR